MAGFLQRGFSDESLRSSIRIGISFILVFCLFWAVFTKKIKNMGRINLEISAIITLSLLINSFSWQHHFVLLLIPFFVIFIYIKSNKLNLRYIAALGLSYILISINLKNPSSMFVIFQSHVFYGALLLYGLNIFLLLKKEKKWYTIQACSSLHFLLVFTVIQSFFWA